jgi:hypothetical protein
MSYTIWNLKAAVEWIVFFYSTNPHAFCLTTLCVTYQNNKWNNSQTIRTIMFLMTSHFIFFIHKFKLKISVLVTDSKLLITSVSSTSQLRHVFNTLSAFPLPFQPSSRPASEQQCRHRGQHYRFTSRPSCLSTRIHQRHLDPHGRSHCSPSSTVWVAPARVREPLLTHAFPTE